MLINFVKKRRDGLKMKQWLSSMHVLCVTLAHLKAFCPALGLQPSSMPNFSPAQCLYSTAQHIAFSPALCLWAHSMPSAQSLPSAPSMPTAQLYAFCPGLCLQPSSMPSAQSLPSAPSMPTAQLYAFSPALCLQPSSMPSAQLNACL